MDGAHGNGVWIKIILSYIFIAIVTKLKGLLDPTLAATKIVVSITKSPILPQNSIYLNPLLDWGLLVFPLHHNPLGPL